MGLGTFCIPGVVVAVEKLIDRPGFVVLWHDTDEKAAKEVYSSDRVSVFSQSGYCKFAITARPACYPYQRPYLRLESWEWLGGQWNIRSLTNDGISPRG